MTSDTISEKFTNRIPDEVMLIIETLEQAGFEAWLTGGCVRDLILERAPSDWDIASDATPSEVMKLFERTVDIGGRHGTIAVMLPIINSAIKRPGISPGTNSGTNSETTSAASGIILKDTLSNQKNVILSEYSWFACEVTTFRTEGQYSDGRRPDFVRFSSSISEDLLRRDFTINAMAYHPARGLFDPFNGIDDIALRLIRTCGDPFARFKEDALRMLRAVRFAAVLDFDIEENSLAAIKSNKALAGLIDNISAERLRDELTKLLISQNSGKFALLYECGILDHILPEIVPCFSTPQNTPHHICNVICHILLSVAVIEPLPHLRWAMLLHDIAKPETRTTDQDGIDHFYGHAAKGKIIAETVLRRLKFDNQSISLISKLVEFHGLNIETTTTGVKKTVKMIAGAGIDFLELMKVREADKRAQNPAMLAPKLEKIVKLREIYMEILAEGSCISLNNLAIDGNDLLAYGIPEGPEIGRILNDLLELVLENPALNEKSILIDKIKNMTS
ncbi:MAG: HD domain-containing protein [Clostridiales bacterium]|nr:HD domain-containing protein [Clostridiales bacterium]